MYHKLKCWPEYFEFISSGRKRFELRENDRNYQVGDILELQEYDPGEQEYTGQSEIVTVDYVLEGPVFGLSMGHCIMSISKVDKK